ncbi:MAG: efflux transporter outer membrane subunit [Proteobacteria bacterium]|nr:efflux transporter outer membrane subunit [Pseudomonadota bacterium]HQR04266.1 efflux transporter outer membrane subunit [Rhodocyclaceae bacterium]
MKRFAPPLAFAAVLIAGCSSFGGLDAANKPADPASLATARSFADTPQAAPTAEWWHAFGDPQLDALVAEALQSSPSLQLAAARLRRAQAQAGISRAGTRPDLSGNIASDRERMSENFLYPPPFGGSAITFNRAALDFSYEIDFWGRNRAALDAALSEAKASALEQQSARLLLAAAVCRSYVELDRLMSQRELAERMLTLARDQRSLAQKRVAAGIDDSAARANAFAAGRESDLTAYDDAIAQQRHQIAALLGAGPDRGLDITRPKLQNAGTLGLPSLLPADLMGRRPDITAQRLHVEAAASGVDVAKADFYPNVNLSAFLGFQSIGASKFLDHGSRVAGIGPAIHLPIFTGGAIRSRLDARYAEYDGAVAQYNNALSGALREIADVISVWRATESREKAQDTATTEMTRSLANARRREAAGLGNRLAVITAEADSITEERRGTDLRALRFAAAIELARALGGGYIESPAATAQR